MRGLIRLAVPIVALLVIIPVAGAAAQAKPAGSAKFAISWPRQVVSVPGHSGITIRGTAAPGQLLWYFDKDPGDKGALYRDINKVRRANAKGQWSFNDQPLGNATNDDIGTEYKIVVVSATAVCSRQIAAIPRQPDGTFVVNALPYGCNSSPVKIAKVIKTGP